MPFFANPYGFVALAAIPAILLIHFLQRKSQRVRTSTLFLLAHLAPESARGRRFERLRSSVPLWLQILAALIVTWILVQPRWIRPDAVQHVVIVVDSTVSMDVFREEMMRTLERSSSEISRAARQTEWQMLESDPTRPTLYSGSDRAAMVRALRNWRPHLGLHDPTPQLSAAQNLLRGEGLLVFLSDRRRDLPAGVKLLAVGHPFDQCGFVGFSIKDDQWRALIRNNGGAPATRRWWLEFDGQKTAPQEVTLQPDQTTEVRGAFPPNADRCVLAMDPDAFALNSRLPFVRPVPKRIAVGGSTSLPGLDDFFRQFIASLKDAEPAGRRPADLELATYSLAEPKWPSQAAIVFLADASSSTTVPSGAIVGANDTLAAGLNWSGLLVAESPGIPPKPGDETLVWRGSTPLIFLRQEDARPCLVVNFDLRTSNAARLPAFVLLLHRFAGEIRSARVALEARNFELNEPLDLALDPALPPAVMEGSAEPALRAPAEPGFFRVAQGNVELLDGAAHFADARAADFRPAESIDEVSATIAETREGNSEADLFAPVWMLLLGFVMIGSWLWRS